MPKRTIALNAWSVEQRGKNWYYGDTYRDAPKAFRGPYTSLASVTLVIARQMAREVVRRQQRMEAPHAAE